MLDVTAQTVVGFFLTADLNLLLFVLVIATLLTIAGAALLSNGRRWHEVVSISFLIFMALMVVAHLFFRHVVERPVTRLETVSITTD